MAVHQPCTWVISLEGNHQPPSCRHIRSISTWWVEHVKLLITIGALSGSQDKEIMPVKMDGVVERNCGLDDDVDPLAHVRKIQDQIPAVCRSGVVRDNANECWVFVLGVKGRAGEVPLEQILVVVMYGDCVGKVLIRRERVQLRHWDKRRKWLIDAFGNIAVSRCRWSCGCILGSCVSNNTLDVECLYGPGACGLVVCTHPVVVRWLIGLYKNHVALSYLDIDDVRFVGDDAGKVHVDDFEFMLIDVELISTLNCTTDKAKQISLIGLKHDGQFEALPSLVSCALNTPGVLTVDEAVVHGPRSTINGILYVIVH